MSYILDSTTIRAPYTMTEKNSTQMAVQRTLSGAINRDFFGSNKRVWELVYNTTNVTDFAVIKAIYDAYIATGVTKTWQVTEANYTVSSTLVHVDLLQRDFNIRGSSYISEFTITLTEA